MFVCSECHDRDQNAIGCLVKSTEHVSMQRGIASSNAECDLCGKVKPLFHCGQYSLDRIAGKTLKCPDCVYKFTCTRLHQLGTDHPKVKLCSIHKESSQ